MDSTIIFLSSSWSENIFGLSHLEPERRNSDSGVLDQPEPAWPVPFGKVLQMQDWSTSLSSSRRADRKTYMVRSVWSLVKLIIIFERFSTLGMQQNQPGRFACMCGCPAPVKTAMLYSGPNQFSNWFSIYFLHGKLGYYDLDLFFYQNKTTPLYKREDHDRQITSNNPIVFSHLPIENIQRSNRLFISTTPLYPLPTLY